MTQHGLSHVEDVLVNAIKVPEAREVDMSAMSVKRKNDNVVELQIKLTTRPSSVA
jgi:hypothetical protein